MEKLLHYLWKHKILPLKPLTTTDGREVEVVDAGLSNSNAGPDFFNAKVRIGGILWVGNVELHMKAGDWFVHGHEKDEKYNNVILHVVTDADCDVTTANGKTIPQLQMNIPDETYARYEELKRTEDYPRCHRIIPRVEPMDAHSWMDVLLCERMEERAEYVRRRLNEVNGNWEWALFTTLARNFGFGLNGDAFEAWSKRIPFDRIGKHRDELFQIEAIFLGTAGLLDKDGREDDYKRQLCREYAYQKRLFSLPEPLSKGRWKYLRLRPQNFPHIRLAELAWIYHKGKVSLSTLTDAVRSEEPLKHLRELLQAETSAYWHTHLMFGQAVERKELTLTAHTRQLLIINTVVPVLYAHALMHNDEQMCEKLPELLRQLPAENNFILRQWRDCGLQVHSAADSQALIQLKRQYCDRMDCLRCQFGYEYLKNRT